MIEPSGIFTIDAIAGLEQIAPRSVDCIVTSPPYWGTRDYGLGPTRWSDGSSACLGLELRHTDYVRHLCSVFDAAKPALKDSGTLWVNLGDVYSSSARRAALASRSLEHNRTSAATDSGLCRIPDKSLCLVPEQFVLEMVRRGWILRNKIVWYKPNHLPTSVKDRFACSWEPIYLFSKSRRYAFDLDAVRVPAKTAGLTKSRRMPSRAGTAVSSVLSTARPLARAMSTSHPRGRNPGDCWVVPTRSSEGWHPAPYPETICERPILAGSQVGGVVLDPFVGTGTTAKAAKRLGRRYIGLEAHDVFAERARAALNAQPESNMHLPSGEFDSPEEVRAA